MAGGSLVSYDVSADEMEEESLGDEYEQFGMHRVKDEYEQFGMDCVKDEYEQFGMDRDVCLTARYLLDTVSAQSIPFAALQPKEEENLWLVDTRYRDPNEITVCSSSDVDSGNDSDDTVNRLTTAATCFQVHSSPDDTDAEFEQILSTSRKQRLGTRAYDEEEREEKSAKKEKKTGGMHMNAMRVKGELLPSELPPIDKLSIHADLPIVLISLGKVLSFVDCLAVVQSETGVAALDEDTVLFDDQRQAIGRVFEVFGPVRRPLYSIRFNDTADAMQSGLKVGVSVWFAPSQAEWTKTVFTDALRKMKGSDASWKDNHECPVEAQDFSDDESERRAKAKRRARPREDTVDVQDSDSGSDSGKRENPWREKRTRGDRRGGRRGRAGRQKTFQSTAMLPPRPVITSSAGPRATWPPSRFRVTSSAGSRMTWSSSPRVTSSAGSRMTWSSSSPVMTFPAGPIATRPCTPRMTWPPTSTIHPSPPPSYHFFSSPSDHFSPPSYRFAPPNRFGVGRMPLNPSFGSASAMGRVPEFFQSGGQSRMPMRMGSQRARGGSGMQEVTDRTVTDALVDKRHMAE